MNIAVYGAGAAGEWFLSEIRRARPDITILGVMDAFSQKNNINNVAVYKPQDYINKYKSQTDAVVIAAGRQKAICDMVKFLCKNCISNIYMVHDIAGKKQYPLIDHGEFIADRVRQIRFSKHRPTLPYIELPIINVCNLNCKGCLFLCNARDTSEVPAHVILKDLTRMKELFEDIPWIRILGGEPLMHSQLGNVLAGARQIFPDSEIDICTNGLLINQIAPELYRILRKERAVIHISGYKPTFRMRDKIEKTLEREEIPYCFLERVQFSKFYSDRDTNDGAYNYSKCFTSSCHELYQGKLYPCSGIIAYQKMNEQFGTKYQLQEGKDYFDIYSKDIDMWRMAEQLEHAVPACRYCDMRNMQMFQWETTKGKAKIEDYIVYETI